MPASTPRSSSVTATPLWDPATGARHILISHPDSEARAGALADVLATLSGLPDATVWADHTALTSVKRPDDLSFGFWAAGSADAVRMLRLAVELADARATVLHDTDRWLFKPTRRSRLILVVADLTALDAGQLSRSRSALDRVLSKGRRTAMPVVALADPRTTPDDLLHALGRTCQSWQAKPPTAVPASDRELMETAR